MFSYQALQEAVPLSCLDRKMKINLFLKSCLPSAPPHNKLYFQRLDQKTLFFEVIRRTKCTIICDISERGVCYCSSHFGAFCWAKSSGRCLTKEGPCPCLYGLPECPRTFLVIFSKRGHTHSLPQFPSRSGHLQIQGQALNQRWHHKDRELQEYASRCPGHRVRGFPILHRACAYLQGMERGFVYISRRTCEIKKAEDQQHGSRTGWVSWGRRHRGLNHTSGFHRKQQENSNCSLLTTGR